MFRISGILMMLFAMFLGALLFWTSQSVQRSENELRHMTRAVEAERDTLRVLHTEWSYLNRPDRLEELAKQTFTKAVEKENSSPAVVENVSQIPEPYIPVIPSQKPVHLISSKNGGADE